MHAHRFFLLVAFLGIILVACAPRSKRFYVKPDTGTYTSDNLQSEDGMIDQVKPTPVASDVAPDLPEPPLNRSSKPNKRTTARSAQDREVISDNTTRGLAAYYDDQLHGRPTASGDLYDRNKLTAAHRTLPFGTRVRVTNERNGTSVIVRINDRGPINRERIIDLSRAAAEAIGMLNAGVVPVKLEVLD